METEFDQFGKPIPVMEHGAHVVETDYRLFRYSKFALPWVLFMLGCFWVLLMLTFWRGGFSNIKDIRNGIPRDLEPWSNTIDGEGGLRRPIRNLRISTAVHGIVGVAIVALVYYSNPRPKLQMVAYLIAAVILIACFIQGIIAFCLDVGKTKDAVKCTTDPGTRVKECESRVGYAVVATALDIITAIFALVSTVMLVIWSRDETFKRKHRAWNEQERGISEDPAFVEEIEMKPIIPGQDIVHKSLIGFGLAATLISAILLLIFTIFIHEFRERVVGRAWDPTNNQNIAAWPKENTRFRLSVSIIAICLCVLSFVPYPKRIYVYVLAWLFFCDMVMHFVIFAMDVNDLGSAKTLSCPTGVTCEFAIYNATCFFDIFNGILILIYLGYEFLAKHKQSTVTVHRDIPAAPLEEFMPPYDSHPEYVPVVKPDGTRALEAPPLRPLLGVEVIEVEHPSTQDLSVTVINVTPGGAAQEAGIKVGDIIARWDEIPITCKADFAQAVSNAAIGSQVILQVIRQIGSTTGVEFCQLTVRGVPA
eukprot:NODE_1834_length_1786_cov_773.444378_g1554_i0.p1 GENE.NODE_1834_length_1786_cov_773.444378_g1554_i0~~NODE_1834_length_1786_cov_773.444378_g1554_i0.p1  ORF type:complete len:554 (+),score=63.73 NODE_1834_length_1786_cov_773.444378_g1554_i0:62-1663(+)